MHPLAAKLNGVLRRVPVWPGYVIGFVPAAWVLYLGLTNQLGAEPIKALEQSLGLTALKFLVAALLVTPIMQLTRVNLIRFRRMIGLMGFYYAVLHFATFIFLDLGMRWGQIATELVKRPYIVMGFAAFLMLIPVAATSNDLSVRKLGAKAWQRVHWLVYPATILAALHFVWLVKSWPLQPLVYAAIVLGLVAWRPIGKRMKRSRRRTARA